MVFPILRWTCGDINQTARQVRLSFHSSLWFRLGLNELALRVRGPNWAQVKGAILRDVNGDGREDLLTWTDQGEVAAVSLDGGELFRKAMPGYVTSAECYPDLADEPRVLVTTREARLYCLRPDGEELWRTDFLDSAKLNGDLPTGYSVGLLRTPEGAPLIMTGNYNLACFVSPAGEVLKYERLPAAYQTMTLPRGFDYDGDGKQDIVSTEVWGVASVLDTDMRRRGGFNLPAGKGILLQYFEPPTPESARAVVCSENGVGLADLKTLKYQWLHGANPITDCVVADVDADGTLDIVVAKQDGYVLVYGEGGELKQSRLVGEPVRAVAVLPGSGRIVAALPGRLVLLGAEEGVQVVAPGEYTKLIVAQQAGLLIAVGQSAGLDAFGLGELTQ
jgi:hypothetical protein